MRPRTVAVASGAGATATGRGAMTAAIVYGTTGVFWAMWGASGLPRDAGGVVALAGVLTGLAVVVPAAVARRGARPEPAPMARSRAYRLVMIGEVVGILGGTVALGIAGLTVYMITWTALVVGLHFVVFGRMFGAGFGVIGALLVAAAAVGLAAGLAGGGPDVLVAVSGLLCAGVLLCAGLLLVTRSRPAGSPGPRRGPVIHPEVEGRP